jgi:3-oxoacyl-[acyl-carrier protein] reductase
LSVRRTALVTGGSRGIGEAVVDALLRAGWQVIAPCRSEMDLGSTDSIRLWCEKHAPEPIDALVNNAGINELRGVDELDDAAWQRMQQINLQAPLMLMRALLPGMMSRGWGRVVNIASIWAHVAKERRAGYSATKAGLIGMTRVAALEAASRSVLVNAVSPGFTETELTRKNNSAADLDEIASRIPVRRLAQPGEIAEVVSWLVSERNTYITGQCICVDGGYTIT